MEILVVELYNIVRFWG